VVGYNRDKKGEVVVSRLDEGTLKEIAAIGHGSYFAATPAANEIERLYDEIDTMEKREIQGGFHAHYEDRFHWFAVLAFLCLAAARLIGERSRPARTAPGLVRAAAWVLAALVACGPQAVAAADAAREVQGGNRALARGDAKGATEHYLKALAAEPERPEIQYNLGNALYEGQQFTDAEAAYGAAAGKSDSVLTPALRYNLGNTLFRQEKYAEAAAAYKQTLRSNPGDEEARWNLELALKKAKQQQQQQQKQKQDQKSKDQKPEQSDQGKNQDQGQEPKDKPGDQQSGQDQSPKPEQNQDQQNPSQEPPTQGQPEPQDQGSETPQPQDGEERPEGGQAAETSAQAMSPEEAQRLLEALGIDEQKLLKERFRARGRRVDVEKDW
jgi:Ca-activated chloride channel family protein